MQPDPKTNTTLRKSLGTRPKLIGWKHVMHLKL